MMNMNSLTGQILSNGPQDMCQILPSVFSDLLNVALASLSVLSGHTTNLNFLKQRFMLEY
jgi:hypothetical protein